MILPVYYSYQKRKGAKATNMLIGLNQIYTMHFMHRNEMKKWFHALVAKKVKKTKIIGKVRTHYVYFYKNMQSDAPNVISGVDKMFMDALQECKVIEEDNVLHYISSTWEVGGQDIKNPRIEVSIYEIS